MGDRVVLAIYDDGKYVMSLYDHWGGDILYDYSERLNGLVLKKIRSLAYTSNDVDNFVAMLVHWWREQRGIGPKDPYTIYLEIVPSVPDHPVVAYDYSKDKFRKIDYETLLDDIAKSIYEIYRELKDRPQEGDELYDKYNTPINQST